MRTPLALVVGSLLVGCTVGDPGTGGDDDGGAVCGDGVKEGTESCDDGNTSGGDGCSATCSEEGSGGTPRVTASIDKQSVTTELGKVETVAVTFTSVDGFAGRVSLASAVQYGTTPGAWVLAQSKPAVDLVAGGSETVSVQVTIPTDSAALAGTLKLDATGSPEPINLTSTVAVANQYTVVIPAGVGTGIPHANVGPNLLRLRSGAKVVFHNLDTIAHRIHGDGGIPHEGTAGGQPGEKYEVTPTANATWYCHTHNEANAKTYSVSLVQ